MYGGFHQFVSLDCVQHREGAGVMGFQLSFASCDVRGVPNLDRATARRHGEVDHFLPPSRFRISSSSRFCKIGRSVSVISSAMLTPIMAASSRAVCATSSPM